MTDPGFDAFVEARGARLLKTSMHLCGGHRQNAEDLLQDALVKTHRQWGRISEPEAYVRQVLARLAIDRWRSRRRSLTEHLTADVPDEAAAPSTEPDEDVLRALASLPTRQRVALVLRYLHDLSVEETARTMQISTGSVKTHCSRGLAALRIRLEDLEKQR